MHLAAAGQLVHIGEARCCMKRMTNRGIPTHRKAARSSRVLPRGRPQEHAAYGKFGGTGPHFVPTAQKSSRLRTPRRWGWGTARRDFVGVMDTLNAAIAITRLILNRLSWNFAESRTKRSDTNSERAITTLGPELRGHLAPAREAGMT